MYCVGARCIHVLYHSALPAQAKYRGTIVTVESFNQWRERFEEEMREEKRGQRVKEAITPGNRMTGEL